MTKFISMQDIRLSLASIASQAKNGTTFVVIRNSRPVFRIVPPEEENLVPRKGELTLSEITGKLDKAGAGKSISALELDAIIHEAHQSIHKS